MARIAAESRAEAADRSPRKAVSTCRRRTCASIEAQRHLDKMTADFERLTERSEARSQTWRASSQALADCRGMAAEGRPGNTMLEDIEGEPPKLNKGESVLDAVERLRRRVRELRADHHRVASAPYPSTYCKAAHAFAGRGVALRGAPDVSLLIEHDRDVAWPTTRQQSQIFGKPPALAFAEVTDVLALRLLAAQRSSSSRSSVPRSTAKRTTPPR